MRPARHSWLVLLLWVLVVATFFAPWKIGLVTVLTLPAILHEIWVRASAGCVDLREAELLLAREQVEAAVQALRKIVPRAQAGFPHFAAMLALGQCAEINGDLADAREMYALATSSLANPGLGWRALRRQLTPLAAAHRAFVLAAMGLDVEAEAALAQTNEPSAFPPTRARAVRARALLLARRGNHRELLDLLAHERVLVRNNLSERDRTLLRVLAAMARGGVEGGTQEAAYVEVEPTLRPWIERMTRGAASPRGQS